MILIRISRPRSNQEVRANDNFERLGDELGAVAQARCRGARRSGARRNGHPEGAVRASRGSRRPDRSSNRGGARALRGRGRRSRHGWSEQGGPALRRADIFEGPRLGSSGTQTRIGLKAVQGPYGRGD